MVNRENEATQDERNLLDLLVEINRLENRCRRLDASVAVPSSVYELLGKLRDEVAKWGTECIVN